jgi:NitT/TauT family transport system ATP-binding protein
VSPILSLQSVSCSFRPRERVVHAVQNVSLDVDDGEFVTIVGPSGCGKSTLLNMIAGLVAPSAGAILFDGRPVRGTNTAIGYVTQADNLLPWRTVVRNVELGLEVQAVPAPDRRRRALEILEHVGLGGFEVNYPHELSGGMRQRTNIARTLVYGPRVILMDEPFGPLDALTRGSLQGQLLRLWNEARKTIVFVTHDLGEAIVLADRVVVMSARPGRIKSVTRVDLPRPRDVFHTPSQAAFRALYDRVWADLVTEIREVA